MLESDFKNFIKLQQSRNKVPASQEDWRAHVYSMGGPLPSTMGRIFITPAHGCIYIYWSDTTTSRLEYQKDSPL